MPTANLIYIYATQANAPTPVPAARLKPLNSDSAAIHQPSTWTKGYFQNVAYGPIEPLGIPRVPE